MKHSLYPAVAAVLTMSLTAWQPVDAAPAQVSKARGYEAPAVFQAAGPDSASIQGAVDAYRLALGEVNNGNAPGPLASGRREINWDGGGSTATSIAATPFAGFLNTRGALFVTPGSGFVQAPSAGLADTFANPAYATIFAPFSPVRLFSPIGSNITHVDVLLAGQRRRAACHHPRIRRDPERCRPAGRQRAGRQARQPQGEHAGGVLRLDGGLLYSNFVPPSPGDAGFAFLGIAFDDARIARVRISTGNAVPGADDERPTDVVVMDDFIFAEPQLVE